MPSIILTTKINAPIERVFDLARSIDLHKASTIGTNEEAISGKTSGLIELHETVSWRAKHLGVYQTLSIEITEFERPKMFKDEMLKGIFKSIIHIHKFEELDKQTLMTDLFEYKSPLGFLGILADILFLKNYMMRFLTKRNSEILKIAESDKWQLFLKSNKTKTK